VTELRELVRALGASDARMEQGSLRCDVNVSLAPNGVSEWGTRTETKNVNSFRSVERAVRFEVERQAAVLDAGDRVVQETRHFHEDSGTTSPGRSKEEAQDYRYFPEPDLVPLAPERHWVDGLRDSLPELPAVRRQRLATEHGFTELEMSQMANAGVLDLVSATVAAGADPPAARGWWMGYLVGKAGELEIDVDALAILPTALARVIALESDGSLTNKLARQVVDAVLAGEGDPDAVIAAHGWRVADESAVLAAVDAAIGAQPDVADKIRTGNVKAVGPLVGAVLKATGGQADAARARELILERLQAGA
jgi:aspartyl-tRNA(Asn)/glutamyl-tRNA(Gln) amidotransferase subunit B